MMTCIHHHSVARNEFTVLKILCLLLFIPLPPTPSNIYLFTVFIILPFLERNVVRMTQYVAFSDCLLSRSNRRLKFLPVFLWLGSSFPFMAKCYSIVWMYYSLFIPSPAERPLGCFRVFVCTFLYGRNGFQLAARLTGPALRTISTFPLVFACFNLICFPYHTEGFRFPERIASRGTIDII